MRSSKDGTCKTLTFKEVDEDEESKIDTKVGLEIGAKQEKVMS